MGAFPTRAPCPGVHYLLEGLMNAVANFNEAQQVDAENEMMPPPKTAEKRRKKKSGGLAHQRKPSPRRRSSSSRRRSSGSSPTPRIKGRGSAGSVGKGPTASITKPRGGWTCLVCFEFSS